MKIAVIGTGYVGLVTGAGFAELGHEVTCVDIDAARIVALARGRVPIHEPQLTELVARNLAARRLAFTTSIADAAAQAAAVFICVGTPPRPDGSADVAAVLAVAADVGSALRGFAVVATKSTVPVGTADRVRAAVAAVTKHAFCVASNPEFLKEGDAVNDFMKPSRIVVGCDDPRGVDVLRELYRPLQRIDDRLLVMDVRSAELAKYAANAMLATRISFMNELAVLADACGADVEAIRRAMGTDPRIGPRFLFAGAGYGGSCFPKDLRALVQLGREHALELGVVAAVDAANQRHKHVLGRRVIEHLGGDLTGKRIAIWGLAFKPDTDDVREAPALALIGQLRAAGAEITAYDPVAGGNARAALGAEIALCSDPYTAAEGADALVLVTEWLELRQIDLGRLAEVMRARALFDGHNAWSPDAARAAGFADCGIGRGSVRPGQRDRPRLAIAR